ncbi:MAG: hypothetical protein AB7O59_16530 [Pirellulales bacterium]
MTNEARSSENPYQSPATDARAIGVRTGSRVELYNVARYQRAVLVCLLLQIMVGVASAMVPEDSAPVVSFVIGMALIAVGLGGVVTVFLLAVNVYETWVGAVVGLLALVPCLGLLVLLAVNAKATSILRRNGIKVGFLGANLAQFQAGSG